jgi:hypothetical protein
VTVIIAVASVNAIIVQKKPIAEFWEDGALHQLIWVLLVWIFPLAQWYTLHTWPANRIRRLNHLLARPEQYHRFIHRILERRYRRIRLLPLRWDLRRAMKHGQNLVVIGNIRQMTRPLPHGAADGFEPIPLYGDNARLADLALLGGRRPPSTSTCADMNHPRLAAGLSDAFPPLHGLERVFTAPVRSTKYFIVLGITLLLTLPFLQSSPLIIPVMMAIIGAICYAFYRLENREYHWWLIPGGLVHRRGGLLTAGMRVRRIPASEAILFFDYGSRLRFAWVGHRRRLYRIACDTTRFPYLLAAWQNRARTPTEDELCALFTGEA